MKNSNEISRALHEMEHGVHPMSGTNVDFSAWSRAAHKYNQRYMKQTGKIERPALVRGWNFDKGTFEVVIAEHDRLRYGKSNPNSVRGRLEQLQVGESAEFDASKHNPASVMSTAYSLGAGLFSATHENGQVVVTRISDEPGRSISKREEMFGYLREFKGAFGAPVSVNTARIYVSQYNRIHGTKFRVKDNNGVALVYLAQELGEVPTEAVFLAKMLVKSLEGEKASAEEIELFKTLARRIVADVS